MSKVAVSRGKVKWFSPQKGYGFIIGEDGQEVFVHYTSLLMDGFKTLEPDQEVSYELARNDKGIVAVNVQVEG